MSSREGEERRVTSFRIDDILAVPHCSSNPVNDARCTATPLPPPQMQLNFGVDQILAPKDEESRRRLSYGEPAYHSYWTMSPYSAHAQSYICNTSCEACYGSPSYQYLPNGCTGFYPDYRSSLSKAHLVQVLPGQHKPRKPRRPWTRAVFSNLQRKGLEKRFQVQKYLTKADRHQLASMLGLTDNQVKVWFQNRRMKWRQDARETVTGTGDEELGKQA